MVANVSGELNGISSGYNLHNAFSNCYELSSCLRSIYVVYSTKTHLKEAANDAGWSMVACS